MLYKRGALFFYYAFSTDKMYSSICRVADITVSISHILKWLMNL